MTGQESEPEVIGKMGVCRVFSNRMGLIHYAKSNDIPVGPGRGSAVEA